MIKKVNEIDRIVYFSNYIQDEDITTIIKILKEVGQVEVCFDVTGRTKHEILGNELIEKLKQKIKIKGYTDYQSYGVKIELD